MALFDSGTPVANVALSDTFNTWRIRTNQINTQAAGLASNNTFTGALNTFSNAVAVNGPVTAPVVTANSLAGTSLSVTGTAGFNGPVTAPIVTANSLAGTITTAAQANITSLGTLTSLTVSGSLDAANADFSGHVTAPTITANNFIGSGSGLTGLSAGLDWSATTSTSPHYMLIASNTSGSGIDQFNVVSGITIHPGSGRITANTFIGDGSGLSGISAGLTIQDDTSTDASYYPVLVSNTSGTGISQIDVSSTKLYFNPSTGTMNATAFNSLSDETLKTNITKVTGSINTIALLEGVEFHWSDTGKKSSGVIAQSIEGVLPHLVETSENNLKTVNYSGIIAYLIEAVKDLNERVEKLEGK